MNPVKTLELQAKLNIRRYHISNGTIGVSADVNLPRRIIEPDCFTIYKNANPVDVTATCATHMILESYVRKIEVAHLPTVIKPDQQVSVSNRNCACHIKLKGMVFEVLFYHEMGCFSSFCFTECTRAVGSHKDSFNPVGKITPGI